MDSFKPGQTLKCTIVREPRTQDDQQTVVRLMRRDSAVKRQLKSAQEYRMQPPAYRYRQGLLLDMVGDADLVIRQEVNSARLARYVVGDVWGAAKRLGVREFEERLGPTVSDDHLPLNEVAKIPTADLIDFEYPYWHTEQDTPDKCSAASLEKVGKVTYEWLRANVNR